MAKVKQVVLPPKSPFIQQEIQVISKVKQLVLLE
jgi:hypothetical protein